MYTKLAIGHQHEFRQYVTVGACRNCVDWLVSVHEIRLTCKANARSLSSGYYGHLAVLHTWSWLFVQLNSTSPFLNGVVAQYELCRQD